MSSQATCAPIPTGLPVVGVRWTQEVRTYPHALTNIVTPIRIDFMFLKVAAPAFGTFLAGYFWVYHPGYQEGERNPPFVLRDYSANGIGASTQFVGERTKVIPRVKNRRDWPLYTTGTEFIDGHPENEGQQLLTRSPFYAPITLQWRAIRARVKGSRSKWDLHVGVFSSTGQTLSRVQRVATYDVPRPYLSPAALSVYPEYSISGGHAAFPTEVAYYDVAAFDGTTWHPIYQWTVDVDQGTADRNYGFRVDSTGALNTICGTPHSNTVGSVLTATR